MTLDQMISKPSQWLDASGPFSDIVYSCRVRLARNIRRIPFSHIATEEQHYEVLLQIQEASRDSDLLRSSLFLNLGNLERLDRLVLLERHLISSDLVQQNENRGLLVIEGENGSVMVNEEDHLRIQAMSSGLNLMKAYELANQIDGELGQTLDYAYHEQWGYLTACPTNVGTGMRASILIHLPGLVITREIDQLIHQIAKEGFAVRGLYGEGSDVKGNFFQLSNQRTLGISEVETIQKLEDYTQTIIDKEKLARKRVFQEAKTEIEDKIWRAYGILRYAYLLNSDDMMNLCSAVRLGISSKWIQNTNTATLNELLVFAQPAHLQWLVEQGKVFGERDEIVRAKVVREKLESSN